jgi:hypothetical protein
MKATLIHPILKSLLGPYTQVFELHSKALVSHMKEKASSAHHKQFHDSEKNPDASSTRKGFRGHHKTIS